MRKRKMPTAPSEQPLSHEEVRRRHQKRARRLMWRRLLVVALLFIAIWLVWKNWDTVAPDKLLAKLQDFASDTAGTYPVDISGTEGRALVRSQSYTALLGDSYLTYYNDNGGEVNRYACTYATPLTRAEGKYVLVAEQGGRRLMLTTRSMLLTELTLEREILSVSLNSKGQFAVLLQGTQGYAVELVVYNSKGEPLYSRQRATLASEVALSADSKTVALVSLNATDGALSTTVEAFSLASTDTASLCSHTLPDTLVYRLEFISKNRLVAVGEAGATVFSLGKEAPVSYSIGTDRLLGYVTSDDAVALVTRPAGTTDGGTVTMLMHDGNLACQVPFDGEFRHLSSYGRRCVLLTDSQVQLIDTLGGGKSATVAADGQQVVLSGNSAVVLGLSVLQEYSLF